MAREIVGCILDVVNEVEFRHLVVNGCLIHHQHKCPCCRAVGKAAVDVDVTACAPNRIEVNRRFVPIRVRIYRVDSQHIVVDFCDTVDGNFPRRVGGGSGVGIVVGETDWKQSIALAYSPI